MTVAGRKGASTVVDRDEHPRPDTSAEALAALKPAFKAGGTVTAGNSSGINDGAAALLLVEADRARELGLRPMARVVATAVAGVHPDVMGIGPVPAVRKVLARAGLEAADLDVIEINEAFAQPGRGVHGRARARPRARQPERRRDRARATRSGASGARLVTMVVHELARTGGRYGLATMCIGVGQGIADDRGARRGLIGRPERRGTIGVLDEIRCRAYDRSVTRAGPGTGRSDPRSVHEMIDAQPTVVSLSDAAATKLRELTKDETNPRSACACTSTPAAAPATATG